MSLALLFHYLMLNMFRSSVESVVGQVCVAHLANYTL